MSNLYMCLPPDHLQNGNGTGNECDNRCLVGPPAPVCGVDGNTIFNKCLALCQGIDIARRGACPQAPLGDVASYAKSGRVTNEEFDEFKEKNLKLISKRNLNVN